jgi:hypothetical protein
MEKCLDFPFSHSPAAYHQAYPLMQ